MIEGTANDAEIYQPGEYWLSKTKNAFGELNRCGIRNFRSFENGSSTSFADNPLVDVRTQHNWGLRAILVSFSRRVFPFNKFFDRQVNLTRGLFEEMLSYKNFVLSSSDRVKYLLENYKVPQDSIRGGCIDYLSYKGKKISHLYLRLLDVLAYMHESISLETKYSYMEIGGGFGVNLHLTIENFPNIRKFIYLDIPPNLYIGTQYLKSFYEDAVIDYANSRKTTEIRFQNNEKLEIYCISPAQIEDLDLKIDVFHNAHSFVEMPKNVVKNYISHVKKILAENGDVYLTSYKKFNPETTLNPFDLLKFFNRKFDHCDHNTLIPGVDYVHFSSPGLLSTKDRTTKK